MKLSKKFVVFAVLLLSIALGVATYWFYLRPVEIAKDAVKDYLYDPESAKFGSVFFNRDTGSVCGLVNAKNRFGGYVGSRVFLYDLNENELTMLPELGSDSTVKEIEKKILWRLSKVLCGEAASSLFSEI